MGTFTGLPTSHKIKRTFAMLVTSNKYRMNDDCQTKRPRIEKDILLFHKQYHFARTLIIKCSRKLSRQLCMSEPKVSVRKICRDNMSNYQLCSMYNNY